MGVPVAWQGSGSSQLVLLPRLGGRHATVEGAWSQGAAGGEDHQQRQLGQGQGGADTWASQACPLVVSIPGSWEGAQGRTR